MIRGTYSENAYSYRADHTYNSYGLKPAIPKVYTDDGYTEQTDWLVFDENGCDEYGYTAYSANGEYVGFGNGVDLVGMLKDDYLGDA